MILETRSTPCETLLRTPKMPWTIGRRNLITQSRGESSILTSRLRWLKEATKMYCIIPVHFGKVMTRASNLGYQTGERFHGHSTSIMANGQRAQSDH